MKIITMEEESFDAFAKTHRYRNFYQTSRYGKLMAKQGYNVHYMGFLNNNQELIGASLILYKTIFMNYKYAYAPNGFLIDYTNHDFVIELMEKMQKLLYRQNFLFIKIDPLIHCSERTSRGAIISYNPEINDILDILKKAGFTHRGFNKFFETEKPRWNAVTKLTIPTEKLYLSLSKQVKNKIRKADKSGIVTYRATKEELPIFYEFIKKKHKRSLKYYQDFFELYGDQIELYLAKIEPEKFVRKSKLAYEKVLEINDQLSIQIQDKNTKGRDMRKILNKKMASDKLLNNEKENLAKATQMFQSQPEGIIVGGAIIIKYDQGANLLIEGFDQKYKQSDCNYYLKWELIKQLQSEGFHYFNLNAVTGEFTQKNKYSGLNEMKFGFASTAIEYIGEFDFVINKSIYKLYKAIP